MSSDSGALRFARYGIVLHFVQKPGEGSPATVDGPNPFDSFSEDLLSYRYSSRAGSRPPIESEILPVEPSKETVELDMPKAIGYVAEGDEKMLLLPTRPGDDDGDRRLRRVAVKASRTKFTSSGYSVCHLAFVNPPDPQRERDFLDEYDIVALSKLWQGGESSELADHADIHVREKERPDAPPLPVDQFAEEIFGPLEGVPGENKAEVRGERERVSKVRVGTVQLITASEESLADDSTSSAVDWREIWKAVQELVEDADEDQPAATSESTRGRETAPSKETDWDEWSCTLKERVIALGGIVAGILDFRAIDAAELTDVFEPHQIDDTSLEGIHKGTLVCVMESDRSYEVVAERIGVSPYLLLPQAALLHNEALLDDAALRAQTLEPETDDHAEGPQEVETENDLEKLSDCFQSMHKQLRRQVPNLFHYPSEQRLFDEGERTRGLTARRMELAEQASGIENRWKVAVEKERSSRERQQQDDEKDRQRPVKILVGLFGVASLAELLSWFNDAFGFDWGFLAWVELLALLLLTAVVIRYYRRSLG